VLSGLQAQQLITLVGLPKSGKSTMVLRMAINAWMSGKVPLFVGFEMSNHEQEARFDAMVAGVDHQKLLTGRLTDEELDALEDVLRKRKSMEPFYLSSDITSSQTVSGLAGKVEQYKPDLLIVDGVYMMFDEVTGEQNTPQALTNITRSMKRLAQSQQIPIMQTTQALNWKVSKKKGLQSDAIGYSSSFLQDSDVVFGVESIEDVNDLKKVSVLDARSAPRMAVNIRWDWSTGTFTEEGEAEFGDDGGEEIRKYEEMGGN
jgi:replicative DNA helicase